jgi:hypothetical protein
MSSGDSVRVRRTVSARTRRSRASKVCRAAVESRGAPVAAGLVGVS